MYLGNTLNLSLAIVQCMFSMRSTSPQAEEEFQRQTAVLLELVICLNKSFLNLAILVNMSVGNASGRPGQ